MLEDRLQDVDKLRNEDTLEDEEKDTIGANYLKRVNSVSFLDISIYIVELPASEDLRSRRQRCLRSEIFLTMTSLTR